MNKEPGAEERFKKIGEAYEVSLVIKRAAVVSKLHLGLRWAPEAPGR